MLVYIHGGSNAYAGAGDMADDALHREGIVVVKVQYRRRAWGFLGLDALRDESPHRSSGNYALPDQLAALKWVRTNIAKFGGDAGNVTITGNSAGALDALLLTMSPLSQGLFNKAIVQSAAPGAPRTARQNEAIGYLLLDRLKLPHGAEGLARLRKLPAATVDAAAANFRHRTASTRALAGSSKSSTATWCRCPTPTRTPRVPASIRVIIGSNSQELGADRKRNVVALSRRPSASRRRRQARCIATTRRWAACRRS